MVRLLIRFFSCETEIGKHQWSTCSEKLTEWKIFLPTLVTPSSSELIALFLVLRILEKLCLAIVLGSLFSA
ncbi:hypothetical protein LINPERHAP2_LOCUS35775 [Linum perenne]